MDSNGDFIRGTGRVTPFLRLDEVLLSYAHVLRAGLRDNFVGVYLLGSLAIGDFDLTSDVDFIVIVHDEVDDAEMDFIRSAHCDGVSKPTRWVKHWEYSLISTARLAALSSPYLDDGSRNESADRQLWYFQNGARTPVRSDHDNTLVSRWTLRHRSRPVLGPQPEAFAPEVTAGALRQEIRSSMLGWQQLVLDNPAPFDNRFHQVFLVLNNCRALQDLHEGRITSKKQGVAWAKQHLDTRWHPLIDYCWQQRQDPGIHVSQPADREAFTRTVTFLQYTVRLARDYPVS